jgi:hypothetical protein
MKLSRMIALPILLSLFSVAPALADSDSFYCTGKGYVAFDLRSFITEGLNSTHVLRVFRFDAEHGIYKAYEWPMKDFQVHAMSCTRDHIVVAGSEDARYAFDIAGLKKRETKADGDDDVALSEKGQLGWSVPGVKTLESSDSEHKYQLVFSNSTKGSEVTGRAELLQIDPCQKVSQRVLLYERRYTEPPD